MSDQLEFKVTCDPAFAQALDSLASQLNKTNAELIRDALVFYNTAVGRLGEEEESAEDNEGDRLIKEIEKAAKECVEAERERVVTKSAMEEASRKDLAAAGRVDNAHITLNACSKRFQDFMHSSFSTER